MGVLLVLVGMVGVVVGLIAVVTKGIPRLRIASRKQAWIVAGASVVLFIIGGSRLPDTTPTSTRT